MEKKVVMVCVIVGFLGLLSAALGFAAETKRVKVSDVQLINPRTCIYPRNTALPLGITAAVALLMAQAITNTVAGCICCRRHPRPSGSNWMIGLICFIVSWITFIIAFLLLLMGAALNDRNGEENMSFGNYCYVVKPGVFAGAAVLSLASVALGIIYYVALSSMKETQQQAWGPQNNPGIVMGQPQFPPSNTQPVFVHEDVYKRQQFP
ncbi:hypothetical protein QJS04_geneDACA008924 [Acorus gramineus]|uniref:Uncharacterized protein n=1 Tax=Acorus gramineus TaxID=55184 RepID=A0AAV9AAV2_ACOGR|nr:hypothetical protein QJS04_geneDACA008924 [Acorus gramineus]